MQIHEVTATLRPELEMQHPGARILFGAVFNTPSAHCDKGEAYMRIDGKSYHLEYEIQFGAVKMECRPLFAQASEEVA